MLAIAGEPNDSVRELWRTTVSRSFRKVDGLSRASALFHQMIPVEIDGKPRHKVYPANDQRFMRIIRKIIRGLCHYHGLPSPVPDSAVVVDVLKYVVPQEVIDAMPVYDRDPDIFTYQFSKIDSDELTSGWLLTFYGRTSFIGGVRPFS